MKYLLILFVVFLTGCTTPVSVKHSLPSPPQVISERCPRLDLAKDDEEKLSELLKVITKNYTLYYECATKHDLLVKWLEDQKAVHDAVFNKGN